MRIFFNNPHVVLVRGANITTFDCATYNMMDEAQRLGIQINPARLEKELGITVVTMAAAQNVGISVLKERVFEYVKSDCLSAAY